MNIAEYLHLNATYSSGSGIGNPWHGPDGKFTNGPAGAFGATTIYDAKDCGIGSSNYTNAAFASGAGFGDYGKELPITNGDKDEDGNTIIDRDSFSGAIYAVSKKFTPEMAAQVQTTTNRSYEIQRQIETSSPSKQITSIIKDASTSARDGSLKQEQISALNTIISSKTRAGSKMAEVQKMANDIKGINNTMKYIKDKVKTEGITADAISLGTRKANLNDYHIIQKGKTLPNARYIKNGEVVVQYRNSDGSNRDYYVSSSRKDTGASQDIQIGTFSKTGEPYIQTTSGMFSSADLLRAGGSTATKADVLAGQNKMFADYQKAYSNWLDQK